MSPIAPTGSKVTESLPSLDRLTQMLHGTSTKPASLRYSFAAPPPYKFVFGSETQSSQILDAVNFQWRSRGAAWSGVTAKENAFDNGCSEITVGEAGVAGEDWEVQIEAK